MGKSCILIPTVKVGNKEIESRLFKDLLSFTKNDRDTTKVVWGLSQLDSIKNTEGIALDSNGEPTIESLKEVFKLEGLLNTEARIDEVRKQLKAIDSNGNNIVYKEVSDIVNSAIEFNKNNINIDANINTSSNGFTIEVSPSTIETQNRTIELVFNNELNNRLLGKLRSVGLDVKVNESLNHNGLFNPLNAEKTAEDTYTVIEIAKGERGESAFPEEFSHAIIEGLSKNPLVDRLISTVNDQAFLKEYLGDKYESYKSMYNNNNTLMAKEVAGKLLAESIKEGNTSKNNLIERLWNIAKNLLSKLNKNDFDSIYKESRRIADGINKSIEDNSFTNIFNINDVFSAKPLASIASEVSKIQELAERSLTLYSKRMDILRRRSKNGEYREEDMEVVKNINKLYDKKNYVSSISAFLTSTLDQIETMHKVLINTDTSFSGDNKFIQINKASKNLRMIKEFNDAYSDIIKELMAIETYAANGDVEILESDAKNIAEQASNIFKVINNINVTYNKARFNTVYSFLSEFWGGDSIKTFGKDAGKILTLESMLSGAERDVNFIDRFISSMGSSSDPLSNLLYKVVKQTQNKRDSMLSELVDEMRVINDKLIKAGYSSDFMYERDSNGTPTMKIISNVDHAKYISDRAFYLESLRNKYDDYFKVSTEMQKWENKHNIKIVVNKESGRTATIPNPALYPSDAYSKLDTIQKEYYDKMMQYKGLLDSLIPFGESRIYDTVNITNDLTEGIINNINNPSKLTNTILSDIRDKFVRRNSDVEASRGMSNNKEVLLDFTGKPVNTLPIYYTQKLDDADRLSTDFTGSLIAYAGMAINYNEMSKIIDALELTRDLMRERDVQQLSGDDKIVEAFTVMNRKFANEFKDKGSSTNIMKTVDDFYDSKIYNQTKIDEGSFTIPILEVEIDKAKTLDTLKSYTGLLGLGLNAFSGISNILAGDAQLLIESGASKYFGVKNLLKAKVQYFNLLAPFLGELNSTKKSSLMYLLGKQFDVTEDFMSSLKEENYNKSAIGRILGKTNVYILNSLGEHYLHYQTLFAMLDNTKIKLNGKTTTLFNAFEVKDVTNNGDLIATKLVIKEGATLENGDKITEEYLEQIKNNINTVNKSMNGGFSELDKGAINRYALGRLAMQFRQWMPEHYNRRLAGAYYDNMLGEWREGYYRTLGRFSLNLIQDLRRAKFEFATRYKELSSTEKENLRRTFTEIGIFASLALFISMMGPAKDKKGSWYDRMIIYQAKRLQLEVGASIPFLPQFIENNWQIIQSPSASIKTINNITDLLMFHNMFNEIKSGRYKGYSKYEKDIIDLIPIYGQLNKLKDITEEDYMFTIFNDKN